MKNKVWFFQENYGTKVKFGFNDLNIIPRIGEYVDVSVLCDGLGGYVSHIQYSYFNYNCTVINIILKDKND